jgi:hypothetical protein
MNAWKNAATSADGISFLLLFKVIVCSGKSTQSDSAKQHESRIQEIRDDER